MRNWINLCEGVEAFYHVTETNNALDIIKNGFFGGWGDVGFGVYLYDNIQDAQSYAARAGWDGNLLNPVIRRKS